MPILSGSARHVLRMRNNRGLLALSLVLCLTAFLPADASKHKGSTYDVTEYGAIADGKTLTTAAMQKAIDACTASGGGRVYVPPGTYLIGTIVLRDNVELYLESGATLKGSDKVADYHEFLIRADKAHNVSIAGRGTIDGSGQAFWEKRKDTVGEFERLRKIGAWVPAFETIPKPRPEMMIRFTQCENVSMTGVRLENSPGWAVHPLACDNVLIDGITIRNPYYGSNTDGIDVDACCDVRISNCDIRAGDDAIVLKNTNNGGLKRTEKNVVVTNCVLDTTCNAFKIGTETTADFENIVFSNSTVSARNEFGPISGISIEMVDGGHLSNVNVSNIAMSGARCPIFIRLGNRGRGQEKPTTGTLKNVSISQVTASHATFPCVIAGLPGHSIENVFLSGVSVTTSGGGSKEAIPAVVPEEPEKYPEPFMFGLLPAYGFYCRHVNDLTLDECFVRCEKEDTRELVTLDDVNNHSYRFR